MAFVPGAYAVYLLNYQVCMAVIVLLAQTPEEKEYSKERGLRKTIIGGSEVVFQASVIITCILVSML